MTLFYVAIPFFWKFRRLWKFQPTKHTAGPPSLQNFRSLGLTSTVWWLSQIPYCDANVWCFPTTRLARDKGKRFWHIRPHRAPIRFGPNWASAFHQSPPWNSFSNFFISFHRKLLMASVDAPHFTCIFHFFEIVKNTVFYHEKQHFNFRRYRLLEFSDRQRERLSRTRCKFLMVWKTFFCLFSAKNANKTTSSDADLNSAFNQLFITSKSTQIKMFFRHLCRAVNKTCP